MSIPILKIFTLFFCVFQMLQNTVRLFWQTRHTFLVALAKIRDYETTKRKIQSAILFQIRQTTRTDIRGGKNKSTNKTVSRASSVEYRFAREGQQTSQTNFRCCGLPTVKHARLRQNLQASLRLRPRSIPRDADGNSRL